MADIPFRPDTRIHPTESQLEHWTIAAVAGRPVAYGPCPECGHTFTKEIDLDVVTEAAVEGVVVPLPPEERLTRQFICACDVAHDKRPDSVPSGCGRWWLASLTHDEIGQPRLLPSSDDRLLHVARELEAASRDEIASVRTWGEKWLPAVAALYGLFGLASITLGKDAVAALPFEGKVALAITVIVGLALTVYAVRTGYQAAFGWVKLTSVANDAEQEQWFADRRDAMAKIPARMRDALDAAQAALVALLFGVGIIWFWPAEASSTVEVAHNPGGDAAQAAVACGKLVSFSSGNVVVQVKDGGATKPVMIPAKDVTKLVVKQSC